jgi:TolA-binding protein
VHADGSAEWSRHVEGSVEKVVLVQGALSIRVEDSPAKRRLLVVLPDGELEDIGTTFTVSAEAGRTTRVSVESGSVVLRLRGKSLVALGAGQTWVPEPPAPPEAQPTSEAEPPPPAEPSESIARLPRSERAHTPVATALPEPPASLDFRAAMALLDAGHHRKAAARFAAFVSQHAGDARVEDATYLRVIALQRAGDTAAMQGAAREYLRRHPNGFRRAEVAALVQ